MMNMTKETRPTGTQAIERAIHLLKLLATRGTFGWGLTDLARRSGLDKATVHRILGCLENERLVQCDVRKHYYCPGPLLVELGLSVPAYQPLLDEGRATITRLAQRTGGVSFFYLRSGPDFVVAGRFSQSVHRGMLNDFGYRRPMIMSAGGVAMLIAMPQDVRQTFVERNLADLGSMAILHPERFKRMLERSLALGYAANLGDVAAGIHSFSVPILDRAGMPFGSLSVAGNSEHFAASTGRKFADMLTYEAAGLDAKAKGLATGRMHATMVEAATMAIA